MRRKHSEVTDPMEIDRILRSATIGRMATNGLDGYPYVTPVNYVWHEGKIYFHCAPTGEKLDNLSRDPRVCFQVDIPLAYLDGGFSPNKGPCALHQFYHCVIIRGHARIVPDGPLKTDALNSLVAAHEKRAHFEPVCDHLPAYRACKVVEITPRFISAKTDLAQNRSEQERSALAQYLRSRDRPGDPETAEALEAWGQ